MIRSLKCLALGLAVLGMVAPQTSIAANPIGKSSDVRIAGGVLAGRVVDTAGQPAVTTVAVFQGKQEIARTQSDANGVYRFQNLHSGNYIVATEKSADSVRLWEGAAPARALNSFVITEDTTVRGQIASSSLLGIGVGVGAVAGVTAAVIVTSTDDDVTDPATP